MPSATLKEPGETHGSQDGAVSCRLSWTISLWGGYKIYGCLLLLECRVLLPEGSRSSNLHSTVQHCMHDLTSHLVLFSSC